MTEDINQRLMWLNGDLLPVCEAKINILSPMAQFGANVFEGIRCYWNDQEHQLYAFRLDDHYKRLFHSMKVFRMEASYTMDDFKNGLIEVIQANGYKEDIQVRQTVFVDGFGTWSSVAPIGMFIAPIPKKRIENVDQHVMRCGISSWTRISDRNLSPKIKVGANYINSRMAQLEASQNGYDSAIFMNEYGKVAEGPGSCLFMVRDGALITPPITASILESITRDTVLDLAKNILHIDVIERDIDRTELYMCDELFLTGSAMEVGSIKNIDGYDVGNGEYLITKDIHDAYLDVVTGNNSAYTNWLTSIY